MSDIPASVEVPQNPPDLDLKQYDHWRDWTFNLQLGHTELPDTKDSYNFGHAAHIIGLGTIAALREGNKNGETHAILTDEKTDEQVLSEASPEDRKEAFVNSVFKNIRGWVSGDTSEEKQYYPTATVALGSAMLETGPDEVKSLILERIDEADVYPLYKDSFKKALAEISNSKVKNLIDYLKFSQTQMTNNETYFMRTGLKEPPPIGSAPLNIGGETYEFEGQDVGGTALTREDEDVIIPLMASNHRGRQEMVEQARETTRQVFNKSDEKIGSPPSWWVNNEHNDGISSKQVLIYAPYGGQGQERLPKVFEEIYKSSGGRGGWYMIEVQKQNGPWLMTGAVAHLTS